MAITTLIPDGHVKILRNTGLNILQHDTFSFESKTLQENFFILKAKYSWDKVAPVRPGQSIRIPVNANHVLDCDYIMFQNSNFSNKWFYAFITGIEWIGTATCAVSYEIDELQTWFFEMQRPYCFVEREHVNDDTIGKNITPENLELGEYIAKSITRTNFFNEYDIVIASTVNKSGNPVAGAKYGGIYSGLQFLVFNSATDANNFIDSVTAQNKGNAIISVFMIPSEFLANAGSSKGVSKEFKINKNITSLASGYTPKNKKLFTYPYNFLYVTNLMGNGANYPYEYFEIESNTGIGNPMAQCKFEIGMDTTPNPTAYLVPANYKISGQDNTLNWNEKLTMEGFPQCAWQSDAYKAWLAQNGSSTQLAVMSAALSGGLGMAGNVLSGNALGAVGGVVSTSMSIAQTLNQKTVASTLPPQAHGAASNTALLSQNIKDFWFYNLTISKEHARIIDDYFDMFGYAVHEVKQPNITGREFWNYVETKECIIKGPIPQESARKIESLFNNGIRFWHGDYMGQYFRRNGIVNG